MSSFVDTATIGIKGNASSAMSGDWKKTKAPNADFGGFSSNLSQIWCDQQKMHIRSLINRLPHGAKALGNVLYMPEGEASHQDLIQLENKLYSACIKKIQLLFPKMAPEKRAHLRSIIYCAICQYRESISPAIEGGTPSGTDLTRGEVAEVGRIAAAKYGQRIDTRNWSTEYKPMWNLIINEIKVLDEMALAPLDKWCGDYFYKVEQKKLSEVDIRQE